MGEPRWAGGQPPWEGVLKMYVHYNEHPPSWKTSHDWRATSTSKCDKPHPLILLGGYFMDQSRFVKQVESFSKMEICQFGNLILFDE